MATNWEGPLSLAARYNKKQPKPLNLLDRLRELGVSVRDFAAPTTGTATEAITRALPLSGEAWSINDIKEAVQNDEPVKAAAMGALSLLPLGGYMAGAIKRGAVSVPSKFGQSGAIFPWLTPTRIESLIKQSSYPGERTKGAITYIKPSEFLGATARPSDIAEIRKEAGLFDPYKFGKETQFPYLEESGGKIINHEGRHRMAALLNADFNSPVPVLITSGSHQDKNYWKELPEILDPQVQSGSPALLEGSVYPLVRGVSLPPTSIDLPLNKIGVTLRPSQKPNWDDEELTKLWDAYYRPIHSLSDS